MDTKTRAWAQELRAAIMVKATEAHAMPGLEMTAHALDALLLAISADIRAHMRESNIDASAT